MPFFLPKQSRNFRKDSKFSFFFAKILCGIWGMFSATEGEPARGKHGARQPVSWEFFRRHYFLT